MTIMTTCAACGCDITNNRTDVGPAVQHGAKLYCAECAAMILPPEDLVAQPAPKMLPIASRSKQARTAPPAASPLFSDDGALGDDLPENEIADDLPAALPAPSPSGSRVQRAGVAPPRRETNTINVAGQRKPSTRTTAVPPPAPAPVQASSTRRGGTAVIARRDSAPGSGRTERPERPDRPDRADREAPSGRADGNLRKRKADSMGLYIGAGVGAVALLLVLFFVFGHEKAAKGVKSKPKEEFVDSDTTPSDVYASKAKDFLDKKDRMKAVELYRKAALRAEKEGNDPQAQKYNMQIVTIEKASTLK